MIYNFFKFFGTNEIILGITSLVGIVGFLLTIFVTVRTAKISKILKYNDVTSQYNQERKAFKKMFEGHRQSVTEDEIKTDAILKTILQNVEEYRAKFSEILSFREKITLWCFKRLLKRRASEVDFNEVGNYLATLSGRLSKKEDIKRG